MLVSAGCHCILCSVVRTMFEGQIEAILFESCQLETCVEISKRVYKKPGILGNYPYSLENDEGIG